MYVIDLCYQHRVSTKRVNMIPRVGDHIEITHIDQKLLSADTANLIPYTLLVTKVTLLLDGDQETFDAKILVEIPTAD